MAILRRGTVRVHHKISDWVNLTGLDTRPITIWMNDIEYWAEYDIPGFARTLVIVYHFGSATGVTETFDAIDEAINGKAVQP